MAMILPVFLTLVLAMIESSRVGMVAQLLGTAARDSCRYAAINGNNDINQVKGRIDQVLSGSGVSIASLQAVDADPGTTGAFILPSNWATAAGGTPIQVVLRVPFTQVSWLPTPQFLGGAKILGSATFSSERP
jgi:Flp pilus assembly protein TadG